MKPYKDDVLDIFLGIMIILIVFVVAHAMYYSDLAPQGTFIDDYIYVDSLPPN